MNAETLWVLGLLALCIAAFVANRPRMDAVALLALLALVLSGILDAKEALAGFSEPSVILIAAFFVIGESLVRTGIALRVGDWLVDKAGKSETRVLVLLMLAVAALGSVMSSTGVVAIFIPVTLSVASRIGVSRSRLMMPLCFAGLISGMLTLVGTPPNLIVNAELGRAGYAGFAFFDFTPMGLVVLLCGVGYMLAMRRRIGGRKEGEGAPEKRRRLMDLAREYRILDRVHRMRIEPDSPLVGQTLGEVELRKRYQANIVSIERQRQFRRVMLRPSANRELLAGDILIIDFTCAPISIEQFRAELGLRESGFRDDLSRELGMAELLLPPESILIGKSVLDLQLRSQRGITVMGIRRKGEPLGENLLREKLKLGDTLLIAGTWKSIRLLRSQSHDFLLLNLPAEFDEAAPALRQAPFALIGLAATIALMISGLVPNVIAALLGCMLMGAFRCIDMESAYRSIHWQSLILIVGMLPFALALQKTGGIDFFVAALLDLVGDAGPRMVMAALFLLTAVIGLFISNTATAVLMAPIGIGTALELGVSPYPFAMTVALAASAAFMTPISSPVNTLVLGPGNYRFIDFVRIGVPFTLIVLLICVLLLPLLFPL
ncbi:SLC13 family permease [Trichloromonas sp.]|uniref:SLC13 family permease n=1 Tax=Trichloromonas sp. TaxID=3069249 RepID=UPI002A39C7CB|nr:SLC13 family permease [Trichloromonas sp.]